MLSSRDAFRAHPLDGAMLYFHAASGTHVRIENAATRALRRQAPRVAMFGITNRCNLRCGFCSRDTARASDWTPQTAAQVLRGLAEAGTLEVAFGGGEPFAFRGFDALIAELHDTTALALNVTTNGTLLDDAMFARFKGRLGQVRVSLYESTRWREAGEVLAGHGQRWGANVLVDDALLPGLPALLGELAWRGCADVSLLSYVGPEPHRHLSAAGRARLAEVIADSPLPCRVSVCLGDSLPVPRLFDGPGHTGDCGAGLDFVSITPDQRMQACSFQDGGLPAASAAEVLRGWRGAQARLRLPSLRGGCARARRPRDAAPTSVPLPPVAVWQAFSGNNSGECVMVARFDTPQAAEAYLAQLLPHWKPGDDCPPEWQALFKAHGLSKPLVAAMEEMPTGLLALGRSVIASGYAADDAWAPLRALAWQQDARVLPGGIHLHHDARLLGAVRGRDSADAQALAAHPPLPATETFVHGETALAILPGVDELADARERLVAWAGGRPLAGEMLLEPVDRAAVTEVLKRLGNEPVRCPRLVAQFWGPDGKDNAARFAQGAREDGVEVAVAGGCVMLRGRQRWKRLVLRAYQLGGSVSVLEACTLAIGAYLNLPSDEPRLTEAGAAAWHVQLRGRLQAALPQGCCVSISPAGQRRRHIADVRLHLHSDAPEQVLAQIGAIAGELNAASVWVSVEEVEALGFAVRRVMGDVRQVPV